MSVAQNSFNDVSDILCNKTVTEVQSILRKTRTDVELKKDELRHLVGERHRDVIEASDNIKTIQSICGEFPTLIENLKNTCNKFSDMLNFNIEISSDPGRSKHTSTLLLRLFLDLPDMVYNAMESGKLTDAAVLSSFGPRLAVKLDLSDQQQRLASPANRRLFIHHRLDKLIALNDAALLPACQRRLADPTSSIGDSIDALVCQLLLSPSTSPLMERACQSFLQGRKFALDRLLYGRKDSSTSIKTNCPVLPIKQHLLLILDLLTTSTLQTLQSIFISSRDGDQQLTDTSLDQCLTRLENFNIRENGLLGNNGLLIYDSLPTDLLLYQCPLKWKAREHDEDHNFTDTMISKINSWWINACQETRPVIQQLLSRVGDVKRLIGLRRLLVQRAIRQGQSFQQLINVMMTNSSSEADDETAEFGDLWSNLFSDAFNGRLKQLLTVSLTSYFDEWRREVDQLAASSFNDLALTGTPCSGPQIGNHQYRSRRFTDHVWHDSSLHLDSTTIHSSSSCQDDNQGNLSSHTSPDNIAHLIVLLQRLRNAASGGHNKRSVVNFNQTGGRPTSHQLNVVRPELVKSCQTLNNKLIDTVIIVTSNPTRDAHELWLALVTVVAKSLDDLHDWTRRQGGDIDMTNLVRAKSLSHLLLTGLCPALNTTLLVGSGLMMALNTTSSNPSLDLVDRLAGKLALKRNFLWTDLDALQSTIESIVYQPLLTSTNRLIINSLTACLLHDDAQVGWSALRSDLYDALSLLPSGDGLASSNDVEDVDGDLNRLLVDLHSDDDLGMFNQHCPLFDRVQLEANEGDNVVEPVQLALPTQASLPLHSFLFHLTSTINGLLAHRLPSQPYLQLLTIRLYQQLLLIYSNLLPSPEVTADQSSTSSPSLQSRALQLVFDVKFFSQLLLSSTPDLFKCDRQLSHELTELKSTVKLQSSRLQSSFQQFIDPFDWESCRGRLDLSVTHALDASSHLYAFLSLSGQPNKIGPSSSSKAASSGDNQSITLDPFIPYLPVMPTGDTSTGDSHKSQSSTMTTTNDVSVS